MDANKRRARFNRWLATNTGKLFCDLVLDWAPAKVRMQKAAEGKKPGRRYVGGDSGKWFYVEVAPRP